MPLVSEPHDYRSSFEYEDTGVLEYDASFLYDSQTDNGDLPVVARTKPSATPVQAATRLKICSLERQLERLTRQKGSGRLEKDKERQIVALKVELKKARSRLKRLLSEAERQRRRRKKKKLRYSLDSFTQDTSDFLPDMVALSYQQSTINSSLNGDMSENTLDVLARQPGETDTKLMDGVKSCENLEELALELNNWGFSLRPSTDPLNSNGESEGLEEVNVQVQLVEEDIPIEDRVQFKASDETEDFSEAEHIIPQTPPQSGASNSGEEQESNVEKNQSGHEPNSTLKGFAEEYSRKHVQYLREWQTQYQEWFEKQMEMQRRWEDGFLQQQMEMAKSMMESVTGTFLQGMQQILHNLIASMSRRPFPPFCPPMPVHFNFGAPYSSNSGVSNVSSSSSNTGPSTLNSQSNLRQQASKNSN